MKIKHIFAGKIEAHSWKGKAMHTAIYKKSTSTPVQVSADGIIGDEVGDRKHHGGTYKAVYAYALEHYDYWKNTLPKSIALPIGAFGENLSIEGPLLENEINLGDTFQCGSVILRASEPRLPCQTLAMRLNYPNIIKEFTQAARFGIYLKVEQEGSFQVGDAITALEKDPAGISIRHLGQIMSGTDEPVSKMESYLTHPHLSPYLHKKISARIAALS